MKTTTIRLIAYSIFLFVILFSNTSLAQQPTVTLTPNKGLHVTSPDGYMDVRVGMRLQNQVFAIAPLNYDEPLEGETTIRRARLLLMGYVLNKKLTYFIQFDMDRGNTRLSNAEYRWTPTSNLKVSFGQFLPSTGRQFRTISRNFQMVDRSIVSRFFAVGYDQGIKVDYKTNLPGLNAIKVAGGITHGEGINQAKARGGLAYQGRLDWLPFGFFEKKGDYIESDLVREQTPKLAIGTAFYFNQDACTKLGMQDLDKLENDIFTYYVDATFKYNGFSWLAEYINRHITNDGVRILDEPEDIRFAAIAGGDGFSTQMGYFLTEAIEPTLRISILNPNNGVMDSRELFTFKEKYTGGVNYFFAGHAVKIQGEMSYVKEEYSLITDHSYLEWLMQISISL